MIQFDLHWVGSTTVTRSLLPSPSHQWQEVEVKADNYSPQAGQITATHPPRSPEMGIHPKFP